MIGQFGPDEEQVWTMDTLLLMILLPGLFDPESHECDHNRTVLPNSLVDPKDLQLEGTWISACENLQLKFECPAETYIDVMEAEYGRNDGKTCGNHDAPTYCSSPETCSIVRERCNKKQKCSIKASNDEFGDPCPGILKYLRVKYRCLPVLVQYQMSELVCEGKRTDISCPEKSYIIVNDAFYGRYDKDTCPATLNSNTECSSSSALQIIKNNCHLKPRCTLIADNSLFGDPCPWTHKYLHVDYHCADVSNSNDSLTLDNNTEKSFKELICEGSSSKIVCPKGSKISIVDASYGRRDRSTCPHTQMYNVQCSSPNTKSLVSASCNDKAECSLLSSNSVFGDPCVGTHKYMEVEYQCLIDNPKLSKQKHEETICEGNTKPLSCPSGSVLLITDALYGRTDKTTCPHSSIYNTQCNAINSMGVVSSRCNYKKSCTLTAENSVFGDPCIGTHKYIHVKYMCIPEDNLQNAVDSNLKSDKLKDETVCEHNAMTLKCPTGSHILVSDANYGRTDKDLCGGGSNVNCGASSSLEIINNLCNFKQECEVRADNTIFGDPCSGIVKYLNVKYFCAIDVEPKNTSVLTTCEHESMKISCPKGSVIAIKHGHYGRLDKTTCPHSSMGDTHCISYRATDIVSNSCNNKEECTLYATNSVFGDPCVNTFKYLQVDYECTSVGSPQMKSTTICDVDTSMLICPKNTFIKISKSEHRKRYNTCPYIQSSDALETPNECDFDGAVDVISEMCEYKDLCAITKNGRPCYGMMKNLQIYYECVPVFKKRNVLLDEHNQMHIRCPFGTSLRILDANYGLPKIIHPGQIIEWKNDCISENARDILSGRCDHKTACLVSAENSVFGDPCVGHIKYANVDYICAKDETNYAVACEHSPVDLECPEGSTIHILKAFYGRAHPYICNSDPSPKWPKGCSAQTAACELYKTCEGRRHCSIKAENAVFGDPCVGIEKYLEVDYICDFSDGPQFAAINKNEPLRNVSFYMRNFTLETSKDFVVQKKKSDSSEWLTAIDGKVADLGKPQSIDGLRTGATYDIRVVRRDLINTTKCQSFVRVTTWPWIDIK